MKRGRSGLGRESVDIKSFSVMVLPLLAHTLPATGMFWTLVSKIGNPLPSVSRIEHLGTLFWYFLCTILAGVWLGEVPGLPSF